MLLAICSGCGGRKQSVAQVHPTASTAPAIPHDPAPMVATTSPVLPPVAMKIPASAPVIMPTKTFQNAAGGISLSYPADWKPQPAKTSVLSVANLPSTAAGHASLSLDIPKLPWHVPGMIPIGIVTNDYASDVRKNQIPDAVVEENVTITVPDAKARRITSVGHSAGKPAIDVAVIMVHNDQVYILSVDSDDTGRDLADKVLDAAVISVKWTK